MLEPQLEAQEAAIPLPATRLTLPRALRNRALLAMASARLTQAKMQSGEKNPVPLWRLQPSELSLGLGKPTGRRAEQRLRGRLTALRAISKWLRFDLCTDLSCREGSLGFCAEDSRVHWQW